MVEVGSLALLQWRGGEVGLRGSARVAGRAAAATQ